MIRATQIITRIIIELLSCISHLEYWDKFTKKKTYIKGPNFSLNPNLKIAAKTFRGCEKNIRLLAAPPFFPQSVKRNVWESSFLMRAVTDRHTNRESRRCIPLNTTSSSKSKAKIWIQHQPQTRRETGKAFKVTVTVPCFLILCFLPITFSRILMVNSVVNSVNLLLIFNFTGVLVITLNSLVNPIIYCVRIRQFRVALIQLLTRKDAGKAENIERRFFGRVNRVAPENLEWRLSG